jgi:protein-S-isoprenylcysteine O-methyltransferase Ste14
MMKFPFFFTFTLSCFNRKVVHLGKELLKQDFKEEYENYSTGVRRWL